MPFVNDGNIRAVILVPFTLFLVAIVGLFVGTGYMHEEEGRLSSHDAVLKQVQEEFPERIASDAQMAHAAIWGIVNNRDIVEAFLARDRQGLMNLTAPLYGHFAEEHPFTHLYFIDLERRVFLRGHQPDRHGELESGYGAEAYPNTSRMDWAVELFGWFRYWLKDEGEMPESQVQIQTNDGLWHVEETWPPADAEWLDMTLDQAITDGVAVNSMNEVEVVFPAFEQDVHISGLPTLHITARTSMCNGGQIFATMYADDLRIGHAVMDIRYRDGGYDAKPAAPLTEYLMLMEFNPIDARVSAGSSIRLVLSETGEDYLPSPCALTGLTISADESSTLSLQIIDRGDDDPRWFDVPPWWEHQPIP